jgi:cation diffusion facilitator CzcD-associated flavoprotein CzcO
MTVAPEQTAESSAQQPVHTRALIIGTGFSGLGMGIALQRQGVDFLILEKADEIGGTWRDNSYPGCACDVPSHLYSFSFEPKATWSKLFSPQPDILDYLKSVTDKYGLRRYIRFNSGTAIALWDDTGHRWHVFTDSGQGTSRSSSSQVPAGCTFRASPYRGLAEFRESRFPFRRVGSRRRPHRQRVR